MEINFYQSVGLTLEFGFKYIPVLEIKVLPISLNFYIYRRI